MKCRFPGPGEAGDFRKLGKVVQDGTWRRAVTGLCRRLDVFQPVIRDFPQLKIPLTLLQPVGFGSFIHIFSTNESLRKKKKSEFCLVSIQPYCPGNSSPHPASCIPSTENDIRHLLNQWLEKQKIISSPPFPERRQHEHCEKSHSWNVSL